MTPKEFEQFKADYHSPDKTIKVNCQWLQEVVRKAEEAGRLSNKEIRNAELRLSLLQTRVSILEAEMPDYVLDIRC